MSAEMVTRSRPAAKYRTLADLLERLGNVPPRRIRYQPFPGTATEKDLTAQKAVDGFYCELVDGSLVEKDVSFEASALAGVLISFLRAFVVPRNLGLISGEQGMVRLFPGLVRGPDVAFVSWGRVPGRRMPRKPIPNLVPDLAIEVLSPGNTSAEMERKRREYINAGVTIVWVVDPRKRTIRIYTSPKSFTEFVESDTLDGSPVLPGFKLRLRELFAELDRHGDHNENGKSAK
jgi:Uma2 family endonuclease